MNERSWDRLLRSIEDGLVVPVVGRQLFTGPGGGDGLQARVARRLLEFHGRDPEAEPLPLFRELDDAVSRIKHDCDLQDLYADVHDIIDELTAEGEGAAPESIRQIAAISHFRLLVTLTPDDLLARCLRRRCAVNEIVHSPYLPTSEGSDLPGDWQARQGEVQLLYVFGKSRPAPMFAIHAEDVLEYAHNIMARGGHVPVRFLGELQQRNLLLIGCSLPEWLVRFFLRLTNQRRLSDTQRRREWLIEPLRPEGGAGTIPEDVQPGDGDPFRYLAARVRWAVASPLAGATRRSRAVSELRRRDCARFAQLHVLHQLLPIDRSAGRRDVLRIAAFGRRGARGDLVRPNGAGAGERLS